MMKRGLHSTLSLKHVLKQLYYLTFFQPLAMKFIVPTYLTVTSAKITTNQY